MEVHQALATLGLRLPIVSRDEVKKVYWVLSMRYHPDLNPVGEQKMKDITAAYSALKGLDYPLSRALSAGRSAPPRARSTRKRETPAISREEYVARLNRLSIRISCIVNTERKMLLRRHWDELANGAEMDVTKLAGLFAMSSGLALSEPCSCRPIEVGTIDWVVLRQRRSDLLSRAISMLPEQGHAFSAAIEIAIMLHEGVGGYGLVSEQVCHCTHLLEKARYH